MDAFGSCVVLVICFIIINIFFFLLLLLCHCNVIFVILMLCYHFSHGRGRLRVVSRAGNLLYHCRYACVAIFHTPLGRAPCW